MASPCRHCGQPHEAFLTMCPITGGRLGSATYTLVNEDEMLIGTVIADRYHVRDILGQGSTGTVFGTVHMHFERNAAMKVLRPRFAMMDTVQRIFHGETRAAMSVSHPSLCEVFDIGTLPDGAPFFVMERLEGDTLAARLGRERFSTASAVDLMMQLLSAMEAMHAHDLLLYDLRPQNIFLAHRRGCRPVVKVLDVGLSRLIPLERVQSEWDSLRSAVGANDSSGLLSIPYYLSPERTRGDHGIEPPSDLFVAAVIFYEALTGTKPFTASSFGMLLQAIGQARPTPLGILRPDVPEDLSALVMRALSANPRARPATAREMQDELRAVFDGNRRVGSSSMRTAPASNSEPERSDSRTPFAGQAPPMPMPMPMMPPTSMPMPSPPSSATHATDRPTAMAHVDPGDLYEDETSTDTDRKSVDVTLARPAPIHALVDEASADHPIRTVRPPGLSRNDEIDVDVDLDHEVPATSRGSELTTEVGTDLGALLGLAPRRRGPDEEEETETMQLTPEVRARIEQMTRQTQQNPSSSLEDSTRPPPTRRLTKPTK